MKDYGINRRAKELSRELLSHTENELKKDDAFLFADALDGYRDAINEGKALTELGEMARAIIATYAGEMADDFRAREIRFAGPTDSELLARALTFYANDHEPPAPAKAA